MASGYHVATNAAESTGQVRAYAIAAIAPASTPAASPAIIGRVGACLRSHTKIAAAEGEARARFRARTMEMTVIVQRTELIDWYGRRGYLPTGETRPFPATDPRFGLPKRNDLAFAVLARDLA